MKKRPQKSAKLHSNSNLDDLNGKAKALIRSAAPAGSKVRGLPDARRQIARKYGFPTWKKLKDAVESLNVQSALRQARKAVQFDDTAEFRRVVEKCPALRASIDEPVFDFNSPLIIHAKSRAMLEELLEAGADINGRSRWEPGSFGLLDTAPKDVASYAIERGAIITAHAAARLGLLDKLEELVTADPRLVHARGGDGQTPLHFASTVEIAEYLLNCGADINALDMDHSSTPAQWMIRSRPEIARFLIQRGCKTDILMAAALGDSGVVESHLRNDPESIRMRVSDEYFPLIDSGHNGGTIYQWELGWYVSAIQVAKSFGHPRVFQMLMDRCPPDEKLLNACWLHDDGLVRSLLELHPDLGKRLPPAGQRNLAHAARNNDGAAVRLMLHAGLPLDSVSQHRATTLHWAAWHGNTELVRLILDGHPSLEARDRDYNGTPLAWAIHASLHGWHPDQGDYPGTVEALLNAGAKVPDGTGGSELVQKVLSRSLAAQAS
jgi:ankyrin repeat protein